MKDVKVLGTGCPKCKTLEKMTREVVEKNNLDAIVTKVDDIMKIMQYNVMSLPALVVDGKVMIKGCIPSAEEIKKAIEN